MCWTCGCLQPDNLHNDPRNIVTKDLLCAADYAGIDLTCVLKNICDTHGVYGPLKKAAGGGTEDQTALVAVMKATVERQYTLGVAYPAMKPDVAKAKDGHRDFVSEAVLEETAWSWMAKNRDIGLFHRGGTEGHATVVESYIYRGPDWHQESPVDGKVHVIKSGDWMLGTIWDNVGWQLVKAGLVKGWSPEGGAIRSTPTPERLAELRSA